MNRSNYWLLLITVGLVSLLAVASSDITSHKWSTWKVESQSLAGASTYTTEWIRIGELQYYNLGVYVYTDCTYFTTAVAGSLGFDIDYEIDLGTGQAFQSDGFYNFSLGAPAEIMSFSISDTTKKYGSYTNRIRLYQSLHTIATAISPAARIRFSLTKDAIHKKITTARLFFSLFFFRQA